MSTHSSVLAWRIPGTGEPGRLPSMGSHRVGHDWSDFAAAAAESQGMENKAWRLCNQPQSLTSILGLSSRMLHWVHFGQRGYSLSWTRSHTEQTARSSVIKLAVPEKAMAPHSVLLPGNPMDRGAWWATVHGATKSWTRLSDLTFTFHFHALEKEKATHSSVLAWRIPGTEEPGGLPSMGSHRVRHDWCDSAALLLCVWSKRIGGCWIDKA